MLRLLNRFFAVCFFVVALILPTFAAAENIELCKGYDVSNSPVDLTVYFRQERISGDGPVERNKGIKLRCETGKSTIVNINVAAPHNQDATGYSVACVDYSDSKTCSLKRCEPVPISGFNGNEFSFLHDPKDLCNVLRKDGLTVEVEGDPVSSLNRLLKRTDLLDEMASKSNWRPSLRVSAFQKTYAVSKSEVDLKNLNRAALEDFEHETPKARIWSQCKADPAIPTISDGDYKSYIQDTGYSTVCTYGVTGGETQMKESFLGKALSLFAGIAPLAGGLAPRIPALIGTGNSDLSRVLIGDAGKVAENLSGQVAYKNTASNGGIVPLCGDYDKKQKEDAEARLKGKPVTADPNISQ
jgi:hypothetical protein